ncbi:MAG: hypothetical protein AAFN92_12570 [Bacteroidota bacterium]
MAQKDKQYHYRNWLIKAPVGLALVGFGICLITETSLDKYAGAATWDWVSMGTLGLIVFNAGLCFFGDAVKHRVHYERPQ